MAGICLPVTGYIVVFYKTDYRRSNHEQKKIIKDELAEAQPNIKPEYDTLS